MPKRSHSNRKIYQQEGIKDGSSSADPNNCSCPYDAMSKKRAADKASSDEQTNEDSDPQFQQGCNAKRAKLAPLSDTELVDLPDEIVESILLRAVVMEVMEMKLANSVWKEKADLVINRLRTVCSQWDGMLMTKFFRNELHRILDGTDPEKIRMEVVGQFPIYPGAVTTMRDGLFLFCKPNGDWNSEGVVVNVYARNNMAVVKDVIQLPGRPRNWGIAGVGLLNCLYLLNEEAQRFSVLRITREQEHVFSVSTWITDLQLTEPHMTVSANGNFIIVSKPEEPNPYVVSIYDVTGSLQNTIMLSREIYRLKWRSDVPVIQRPNGNFVVFSSSGESGTQLLEIDLRGNIVRQYQPGLSSVTDVTIADSYGRICLMGLNDNIELVDSEFNRLDLVDIELPDKRQLLHSRVFYCSEWNELMRTSSTLEAKNQILTTFRFTEK